MSDDLRNRVARTMAYVNRQALDASTDSGDHWQHTCVETRDTWLKLADAALAEIFVGPVPDAKRAAEEHNRAALAEMGGVRVKPGQLERIVWSAMAWARENPCPDEVPEYTDRGNSFAETECRATVARILAAIEPAPSVREAALKAQIHRLTAAGDNLTAWVDDRGTPDVHKWDKARDEAFRAIAEGKDKPSSNP